MEAFRIGNNPEGRSGGLFKVLPNGDVALNRGHFGNYPVPASRMGEHFIHLCKNLQSLAMHDQQQQQQQQQQEQQEKQKQQKQQKQQQKQQNQNIIELEVKSTKIKDEDEEFPADCCIKFFDPKSKGLLWHRHSNHTTMLLFVGISLEFLWKNHEKDPDNILQITSGDVLMFEGRSSHILHRPSNMKPGTLPKMLQMKHGLLKFIVT